MLKRSKLTLLLGPVLVLATLALFSGAPALALEVHVPAGSFGSSGAGSGEFNQPTGVAVNDVTHDVYVVDGSNNRVEEFNAAGSVVLCEFNGSGSPTGAFSEATEIAVDNSGSPLDPSREDVYVVDRGHGVIDKFNASCGYEGQLTGGDTPGGPFEAEETPPRAIRGVAVDPNGVVWVSTAHAPIYSFSDGLVNQYLSEVQTEFGGASEGLAVDAEDNLYFNRGERVVVKVNSSGLTLENPFGGDRSASRVAVDPVGHEVYLDNEMTAEAFSLGGARIESFGADGFGASWGVAVDASNGTVYVTDRAGNRVVVFDAILLPSVKITPASEQQPRSLTLNGTVDPEGLPVTSCVFEYGTTSAYGQTAPCVPAAGQIPVDSSEHAVSASISGLTPGATYHYRLVAENVAHVISPTADQVLVAGPVLGGESVDDVASSSATLRAPIDPNGGDTHFYVQYGTGDCVASPSSCVYAPVAPPGVDLGSAVGAQPVSVHLQGLQPGTSYNYRFVVAQGGEVFEGPGESFMTQSVGGASALVDGRAWELVSPPDKHGALIELFQQGGQVQAAADGSGISYLAQGPSVSESPAGKTTYAQVLSRRGPAGWSSADLTLPGRLPENGEQSVAINHYHFEYELFSPDLSLAAVEPEIAGTPPLAPGVTERTLYLRDDLDGSFSPLATASNVFGGRLEEPVIPGGIAESAFEMHFLAATPDLGNVVFQTPLALTPEAIDEETIQKKVPGKSQENLYEWGGGELHLVNVLPESGGVAHGPRPSVPPVRLAGMADVNGLGRGGGQRDVSSDGRRIAWAWGEAYTGVELSHYRGLYVRDMVEERTLRVGGATAKYQTMNSEGSKIFFLENGDLYVYDFETETQTDLTGMHGLGESSGGVQELVSDVSEDGSSVYFVATGVLANGGVSGADNLYLLHNTGSDWTTTYIVTLSAEDMPSWYAESIFGAPYLAEISSRVSPDGRYLTFMSDRSLTGYDNTDADSGQPDEEVYLYDAQTGKLACASCDPTGARPAGVLDTPEAELLVDSQGIWTGGGGVLGKTNHWLAGSIPGWDNLSGDPATYQPRYLSDSGRLFFDSPVALVPRDTNGLEDVYEFEPAGIGDCTTATATSDVVYSGASGGCVGLISSGTSSGESAFYDASENGDDVFFSTTGRLVGEDFDKSYDIYDAHVCTSAVPCKPAPVSSPPCTEGESCKAAPTPQPEIFGPAPSATFNGAGNPPPTPSSPTPKKTTKKTVKKKCAKGKQLAHGKCVKRKQAKQAEKANTKRRAK